MAFRGLLVMAFFWIQDICIVIPVQYSSSIKATKRLVLLVLTLLRCVSSVKPLSVCVSSDDVAATFKGQVRLCSQDVFTYGNRFYLAMTIFFSPVFKP